MPFDIKAAIAKVSQRRGLTRQEMTEVMRILLQNQATPAQVAGFLMGLRMKGETVTEIAAAAKAMRSVGVPVRPQAPALLDVVGTGGDGASTFNVSMTSAFVAAVAGAKVARHGNRAATGCSGSADVLACAGVNLNLTPEQIATCIDTLGIGFMFAPQHYAALQAISVPRRELGVRTLFNLLGPLTNPAGAQHYLLGVYAKKLLLPFVRVLKKLGVRHALVVHAEDGLDEISISAPTDVMELKHGEITHYQITPEQFGVRRSEIASIQITSVEESLALLKQALTNQPGTARDIVTLNAGAAIYAADLAPSIQQGIEKAQAVLKEGRAWQLLLDLVALSQKFAQHN